MPYLSDLEYYARRAQTERESAARSTDPMIARLHRQMAERYEAIVAGTADNRLRMTY